MAFRLKAWAERFLVVRAALYEDDFEAENKTSPVVQGEGNDLPPRGLDDIRRFNLEKAVSVILKMVYVNSPTPVIANSPKRRTGPNTIRNEEICNRYSNGESIPTLARAFGISNARVHQIIHGKRK